MIAITLGDPAGVGPEVLLKALPHFKRHLKNFLIIGDRKVLESRAKLFSLKLPQEVEILSLSELDIEPSQPTLEGYQAMLSYLEKAISLAKDGQVKAIVTLPITKEGLAKVGSKYRGHTELLADAFGVKDYVMCFYGKRLIVSLLTTHLPLKEVPGALSEEKVLSVAKLSYEFLGKIKPKKKSLSIALCGLNPHAGEAGLLGDEEIKILIPAVEKAKALGIPLSGPYPSDSLFYHALQGKHDLVIAVYHDQGLAPFKLIHFRDGVNVTLGLPIIRTSPCHGTAYDIAPLGLASPESLISALKLSLKLLD
jgi:4-hydroxythreonine-4-phosphate dehydrogenase